MTQENSERLGSAGRLDIRRFLLSREIIVLVLIIIAGIAAANFSPYFLTAANMKNVVIGMSIEMVVAI